MAHEILKRDADREPVSGGVTDNAALEVRMLRVDPTTNRLKVDVNLDITGVKDGDTVAATDYGILVLGTDGSNYQILKVNSDGELIVNLETADIEIGAVEIKNSTDDTRATVGASGLYVDVQAIVPGVGATNLGKAEDAVHASGDVGVMALAVRNDDLTPLAADGDYHPLTIDGHAGLHTAPEHTITLDELAATAGWTVLGTDTTGLTTNADHISGTASVEFDKVDGAAGTVFAGIQKTLTSTDLSLFHIHESIHLAINLSTIANVDYVFIRLGTDSSHYNEWRIQDDDLTTGWQVLKMVIGNASTAGSTGNGWNPAAVTYAAVGVAFDDEADELLNIRVNHLSLHSGLHTTSDITSEVTTAVNSPNIRLVDYGGSVDVNAGNVSAGTLRVVLATDQNFIKLEDVAHSTGDAGIMALAVENEDQADLSTGDKDYTPIAVTKEGNIIVKQEGTVAVSLASVPSHAVTNAGTFAVQIVDPSFAVADGNALGEGVLIQGDDGTDRKNINVDPTTGDIQVDLTAGAAVVGKVRLVTASGDEITEDTDDSMQVTIVADDVGIGGGTEYTEDVATANPQVGNAIMVERDDQLSAVTPAEADWIGLRGTEKGALWVALADASGDPITSFGGGQEYTEDAAVPANPIGKAMMMERDDALGGITPAAGDWTHPFATAEGALWVQDFNSDAILADTAAMVIDLAAIEALAITIDADTNAIKTAVELLDNAIDGNYLNVNLNIAGTDVSANAGVLTAQTQRVTIATDDEVNNLLGTIDTDTGNIVTAVQLIDDVVAVLGTATYTEAATKGNIVGAVRNDALAALADTDNEIAPLQVNADGALYIDVAAGGVLETLVDDIETVLGTIDTDTGKIVTAVELLDNAVDGNFLNVNLNLAGSDADKGEGVLSANTLRVSLATDDDGVAHLATIAGDTTSIQTAIEKIDGAVIGPGEPTIDSYTQASINLNAGANQVLVSSAASKQIWVYGFGFTVSVAGTVSFQDEDDLAITGIMDFAANSGMNNPPSGNFAMPIWKLATNKDLEVDIVDAALDGWISYAIVSV